MEGTGFLAIWSDLSSEDQTDWTHWMTREHAIERLGIPGFLACRVFRAVGMVASRHLILYELTDKDVVGSVEYLARLNAPSQWSQRIMPRLRNFARCGGRVAASAGTGQGGLVAALPLEPHPQWDGAALCRELASLDRIAAARVLLTDLAQTSIRTSEKSMRANDDVFAGLLLIEGFDETSLRKACWHLHALAPRLSNRLTDEFPLYTTCFTLHRWQLPR